MQISNRANGDDPQDELNKHLQLTFSDGYTTEVNALAQSLTGIHQTISLFGRHYPFHYPF